MAVLMVGEASGQTPEGYDGMMSVIGPELKVAPGFLLRASHPIDNGWRVIEVWETREDATRFYATHVAPRLPKGIRPKMTFAPLHDLMQP
jgi:hypothetical protein